MRVFEHMMPHTKSSVRQLKIYYVISCCFFDLMDCKVTKFPSKIGDYFITLHLGIDNIVNDGKQRKTTSP